MVTKTQGLITDDSWISTRDSRIDPPEGAYDRPLRLGTDFAIFLADRLVTSRKGAAVADEVLQELAP